MGEPSWFGAITIQEDGSGLLKGLYDGSPMVPVPLALLEAARDYIGSMSSYDFGKSEDRFFDALRIVEPMEKIIMTARKADE